MRTPRVGEYAQLNRGGYHMTVKVLKISPPWVELKPHDENGYSMNGELHMSEALMCEQMSGRQIGRTGSTNVGNNTTQTEITMEDRDGFAYTVLVLNER